MRKGVLGGLAAILAIAAIGAYQWRDRDSTQSAGNVAGQPAATGASQPEGANAAEQPDGQPAREEFLQAGEVSRKSHPLLRASDDAVLAEGDHSPLSTADPHLANVMRTVIDAAANVGVAQPVTIDYPWNESVFPPEIIAPTFLWHDDSGADTWLLDVSFEGDADRIYALSPGHPPREGPIDPRCVAESNEIYRPTPYQASARSWAPAEGVWETIKQRAVERPARVTILGFDSSQTARVLSRGQMTLTTSRDPVGAPIFYRDVPLAPSRTLKGVIKPLREESIPLIAWRLRDISKPESRLLLTGVRTCTNCHSFSADGRTLGLDLDGPKGDKGSYVIAPIQPQMSIEQQHVISWNSFPDKLKDHKTIGFLSQVSPDGEYVVTTLNESVFVWNFLDYRFLQVFYPTRGILGYYRCATGEIKALPGADDPQYVHCDAVWTPDGQFLVFARGDAQDSYLEAGQEPTYAGDPAEVPMQYSLYRMPFNAGQGGQPEPIEGASHNGMSNTFPKVSPDGKWIVFVKCRNGQLMRPDSRLWIVPAGGGTAREMRCNTSRMNSWHSFSPNSRWMVFSSKVNTPYTQMFLTHIDEDGNDSPPILIPNSTAANRAVNLPEFVNVPYEGLVKIDVPAVEYLNLGHRGTQLLDAGKLDEAMECFERAVALQPDFVDGKVSAAVVLIEKGKLDEALARIRGVLAEDPDNWFAHVNLGVIHAKRGRLDEAIATFETAINLNPDDAKARVSAGRAYLAKQQPDRALGHFQAAAELAAEDPLRHFDLGNVLFQKGQRDGAIAAYEKAVALDPKFVDALLNLAHALTSDGNHTAAVNRLRQVLEFSPHTLDAINDLAWLLATSPDSTVRDGGEAVRLLEPICRSVGGGDPLLLSTLAAGYAEQGRWEEALGTATHALRIAPPSDEFLLGRLRQELEQFQRRQPLRSP